MGSDESKRRRLSTAQAWSAAPAVPYTPEESADLVRKLKGALEAEVSWSS